MSRFTANGNVAVPGSEVVLLDLNTLSIATNHNGGAIHFGNDGKLYIAVGDNANGDNAQTGQPARQDPADQSRRLHPDRQSVLRAASGANRAIWAMGLRNPFTTAFQRSTGRLFINDVGETTWEEINEGVAAPTTAGRLPKVHRTIHASRIRSTPTATERCCAITGGAFYESDAFPTRITASTSSPTTARAGYGD